MTLRIFIFVVVVIMTATAMACFAVVEATRRTPLPRQGRRSKKVADMVPQGGGIAIIPVLSIGWITCILLGVAPACAGAATLGIAGLAAVSLQDMRVGVAPLYLYTSQTIAVVLGLTFLPGAGHVFHSWLPVTLDLMVTTALWIGMMQAMPWNDRREGLSAISLLVIGIGTAAVAFLGGDQDSGALGLGVVLAAVAIGYLPWAWPPSRLLLGTVGTIPLGYAMAWLLASLAGTGQWAAALILPGHLLGRLIWSARDRIASGRGLPHASAPTPRRPSKPKPTPPGEGLAKIMIADAVLIGLACLSTIWPWPALLAASLVVLKLTRSLTGLSGLGFRWI